MFPSVSLVLVLALRSHANYRFVVLDNGISAEGCRLIENALQACRERRMLGERGMWYWSYRGGCIYPPLNLDICPLTEVHLPAAFSYTIDCLLFSVLRCCVALAFSLTCRSRVFVAALSGGIGGRRMYTALRQVVVCR